MPGNILFSPINFVFGFCYAIIYLLNNMSRIWTEHAVLLLIAKNDLFTIQLWVLIEGKKLIEDLQS